MLAYTYKSLLILSICYIQFNIQYHHDEIKYDNTRKQWHYKSFVCMNSTLRNYSVKAKSNVYPHRKISPHADVHISFIYLYFHLFGTLAQLTSMCDCFHDFYFKNVRKKEKNISSGILSQKLNRHYDVERYKLVPQDNFLRMT